MSYFTALKIHSFRRLWAGQTISRTGDFLYQVALAWWVLEQTGSAAVMGAVLICSVAPMLVFVLLGGIVVDRFPRARLMLMSDLGRGVIAVIVTALAATHHLEVWHVYVASTLFGFVDAFFQPAYAALIPEIVPAQALPSANAITSLGVQIGRIVGPVLGATIIAAGGTPLAFAIDAASFFVSAALLLPLRALPAPRSTAHVATDVVRDLREGIGAVFGTPWLWLTIVMIALTNVTLGGPYQVALPFLVDQHFGGDVRVLGLLYSAFPVGYIVSALWIGRYVRLRRRGWMVYGTMVVAGLGMLVLGLPIGLIGALVAATLNGAALQAGSLAWTNTLQNLVPNDRLGRIASIDLLSTYGLIPVGFVLAGWATSSLGAANVCLLGGTLTAGVAALGLFHPAIHGVD
jgi:MFS family permease